ncbi:MAG: GNAT family N-acetyltransferase [Mesorhizobium amorphae]|nr:MAG: GNAT family N-acetyltransferase [Mesorhizobium amorphae]
MCDVSAVRRPVYDFREVEESDLALIRQWLETPHWREWWGDPDTGIAEIREHMDSVSVEPLLIEWNGAPIGYLQSYDPHLEDDHPYADQPFGTLGVDLSIGAAEMLGQGHGSGALRAFAETLFAEGVPRLVIDPHPDNARAIRAYAKAGFVPFDRRTSIYGEALLMALDNPDPEEAA